MRSTIVVALLLLLSVVNFYRQGADAFEFSFSFNIGGTDDIFPYDNTNTAVAE